MENNDSAVVDVDTTSGMVMVNGNSDLGNGIQAAPSEVREIRFDSHAASNAHATLGGTFENLVDVYGFELSSLTHTGNYKLSGRYTVGQDFGGFDFQNTGTIAANRFDIGGGESPLVLGNMQHTGESFFKCFPVTRDSRDCQSNFLWRRPFKRIPKYRLV
jgi:hypothetical protein